MMKKEYILKMSVFMGVLMAGCSHSPRPSEVDVKQYTQTILPVSFRHDRRVSHDTCPRQESTWKTVHWQKLMSFANACLREGRWAEVEALGNHLAQKEHVSPWGSYYLSLAAQARKNYPRALWMAELALKKAPREGLLLYQKSRVLWQMEQFEESVQAMQEAVKYNGSLVDGHLFLGRVYYRDQAYKEAIRHFQAVLVAEPRHLNALLGLAESRLEQKDPRSAVELLSRAIDAHPRHLAARLRLAHILEHNEKDYEKALVAYREIQSLSRQNRLDHPIKTDLAQRVQHLEGIVSQVAARKSEVERIPSSEGESQ